VRKPLLTNRKTSRTHRKEPLSQETAGKLYRVRDRGWTVIWGDGLSWQDANKLKNQVAGRRLSKTVRVESMEVPQPEGVVPKMGPAEASMVMRDREVDELLHEQRTVDAQIYGANNPAMEQGDVLGTGDLKIGAEPTDDDLDEIERDGY